MTVQGLESNGYLINNPIILQVYSENIVRLEIIFYNEQNGKSVTIPNLYPEPINQKVIFSIDKIVKGLFTLPNHNDVYQSTTPIYLPENTNRIIITLTAHIVGGAQEVETITKTFIRGGRYNDLTNQSTPSNRIITPTEIMPIFAGYPSSIYWLDQNCKVQKLNQSTGFYPNYSKTEYVREKSCNGKYLAFLNSLGGYSYWLFDNFEEETNSANLGIVNNGFNRKDLGATYENSFKVFGKIQDRFYPLMRDLILSPDIWEWQKETQTWKKIYSDGNKWVRNGAKSSYKIDYKFSDFNNLNPSLI